MKNRVSFLVLILLSCASITKAQDSLHTPDYPIPAPPIGKFVNLKEHPLFPSCIEMEGTPEEKKQCSELEMRKFLLQKAGYPFEAREKCIEGKVFVNFVVMPDGSIDHIEVEKDLTAGGGLAEACIKAIESMNRMPRLWKPGIDEEGIAVPVQLTMPFVFKIDCSGASYFQEKKKKKKKRK